MDGKMKELIRGKFQAQAHVRLERISKIATNCVSWRTPLLRSRRLAGCLSVVKGELNETEFRNTTANIAKSTMLAAISLEIKIGSKEPSDKTDRNRPTWLSLALRIQVIKKYWTKVQGHK
jgi:hypothetical protein